MTDIDPAIWDNIDCRRISSNELSGKVAFPDITDKLLFAKDLENKRHLLIRPDNDDIVINDISIRGIEVTTKQYIVDGKPPEIFIDLMCLEKDGYIIFNLIGSEMATKISERRDITQKIVDQILRKWKRFWGPKNRNLLNKEEIKGLFGELWFLSEWLIPKIGIEEAVFRWKGPSGSRHDFEWINDSVEIKTSTRKNGRIHRIHSLEQLESPENGDLFLFSLLLRIEDGASNTLPIIIKKCIEKIRHNPEILELFENNLEKNGYFPADEKEYENLKFRVVNGYLYIVNEDFPKITTKNISNEFLSNVGEVEYNINLAGCEKLICARDWPEIPFN